MHTWLPRYYGKAWHLSSKLWVHAFNVQRPCYWRESRIWHMWGMIQKLLVILRKIIWGEFRVKGSLRWTNKMLFISLEVVQGSSSSWSRSGAELERSPLEKWLCHHWCVIASVPFAFHQHGQLDYKAQRTRSLRSISFSKGQILCFFSFFLWKNAKHRPKSAGKWKTPQIHLLSAVHAFLCDLQLIPNLRPGWDV